MWNGAGHERPPSATGTIDFVVVWPALLLLVAGGGWSCAGVRPTPALPAPVATPSPVAPGATVFAKVCMGCHDAPDPPLPDFATAMTTAMAGRALRAVLEERMPPPMSNLRAKLSDQRRSDLIGWLCQRTGRNQRACTDLLRYETAPDLMRGGIAILQDIKNGGGP